MGCGASKVDDLPLVTLCKERQSLIRSAAEHRFALAVAHIAYFNQLKHVGDSLLRFVEEELILSSTSSTPSSPSSISSPVLTLPSDEGKPGKGKGKGKQFVNKNIKKKQDHNEHDDHGHLRHLSSSSFSTSDTSSHHHHHNYNDKEQQQQHQQRREHHPEVNARHYNDDGHLDFDEEEEKQEEKLQRKGGPRSPRPGISYMNDVYNDSFGYPNGNFGYPVDPSTSSYGGGNNSGYPPVPPPYYYQPQRQPPMMNSYENVGGGGGFSFGNPNPLYNYPNNGNGSSYSYFPESNNHEGYNYNGNVYGSTSGTSYTAYYMRKASTRIPSVVYEEPKQNPIYMYSDYQNNPPNGGYSNPNPNPPNGGGGYFGYSMNPGPPPPQQERREERQRPPTPPSPKVSAWDFFNPFESYESTMGIGGGGGGGGYSGYGYESNTSSPDSREVREREGIPELEEETESEVTKEPYMERKKMQEEFSFPAEKKSKNKNKTVQFEDMKGYSDGGSVKGSSRNGGSRRKNSNFSDGSSQGIPVEPQVVPEFVPEPEPVEVRDVKGSSPDTETSISTVEEVASLKRKGVNFEPDGSHLDIESSKLSSLTTLSAQGTRDLKEVVVEIKDEFEAATDYGKEVSVLLEAGVEPYRSRKGFFKVLAGVCSASGASSNVNGDYLGGLEDDFNSRSLSATLDKLYAWEKKLFKEVKDEERLRVLYEKQCKRLKSLDERGAESNKIEATQVSIRKLLTKLNVSVKAVNSISNRIHKLRDEELHPRLKELIYGLKKMWRLMLKCHRKQFQAILESKTRALKANTGLRRDSSVRATIQLEAELLKWCQRFSNWIDMQRSYADTLNNWLERCLQYEPEVTADGVVPFSPARIGAPPVFVICHDWKQAMERVSNSEVQTAMNDFATSLHQLWERQDEEQRRRLKSENMYKDFEKQIRAIKMERQRGGHEHDDTLSDKNSLSMVASESGISPLDDLKVDLDSMKQRVREERAEHKVAVKRVHDAVSQTIQEGLIPIFDQLQSFTSEATKAFDDVRLEYS